MVTRMLLTKNRNTDSVNKLKMVTLVLQTQNGYTRGLLIQNGNTGTVTSEWLHWNCLLRMEPQIPSP